MSKPLSNRPPGHHPSLSGAKGPDRKKLVLIGISIGLGILILIIIASVAFSALGKNGSATPVPSVTPEPTPEPTATPVPTPSPSPVPTSGQVYSNDGPFFMRVLLNGDSGQLVVGLSLSPGAPNVVVSGINISIECDGQTYSNVWGLKPMDWNSANNNTVLEQDEKIATILDTKALGIPQGKPLTVKVTINGDLIQQVAVAPTY